MKKKLSYLIVCLITMITLINSSIVAFADETYDNVNLMANYGVVIDYETGKVLGGKNIDSKVYPASTTKIWTAYLVVKNVKNLDEPVEITEPPGVDGSSMYLEVGELLQGLLIHSSNDAAVVLAKYVSGSTQDFAQLMNKEAKKAGALNTHFNNPHGLPDDNHYTTPYDMAMLARKAMSEKVIREIVSTKSISFKQQNTATSKINTSRYFTNTNLFLTSNDKITYRKQSIPIKYDIVDGIKTGYTDDAGRCLLSSAVKNDMRVIAAVFKSFGTNVYVDSRTLLDYGFENYTSKTIINKDDYTKTKRVLFTKEKELLARLMRAEAVGEGDLGMLMVGNLFRESGVVKQLQETASNALMYIVVIVLGLSVGATTSAERFLKVTTIKIVILGLIAFAFGTAAGVIFGKLMCKVTGGKVNPLIGSAGVSAVPMAARVSQKVGSEADPTNFLLMHAMGPNVAGVIGTAVAAGTFMAIFGV